jgi:putative thioredoxin
LPIILRGTSGNPAFPGAPAKNIVANQSTAVDVGRHNFDDVVLAGSRERPVLVDFWAPWCGPCKMLAPILDKLAVESAGRFTLAKLNTDDEPELASRYGIRGIPNVKAFADGEVVDEFTGVLPEGAIREFLARVVPSPAATLLADARTLLARGDALGALGKLDQAFAIDPDDEEGLLLRAEALLALGRADQASAILAELDSPQRRGKPVKDERKRAALKARIALATGGPADLAALAGAAAKLPIDCAAKLAYADALAAKGDYERALAELLAIVAADRRFDDDVGRRRMLTIFEALGNESDLVRRYRRELAAVLNR